MSLVSKFRAQPILPLAAAIIAVCALGAFSLIYQGLTTGPVGRVHLGLLTLVLLAVDLVFLARRNRAHAWRALAFLLSAALFAVLGLFAGGYDHLFKDVLYGHGLPQQLIDTLVPNLLGAPGDLLEETAGLLLLPLGIAGLFTLKGLRPREGRE